MGKRIDLPAGFESGLLTVIEKTANQGQWSAQLCKCSCGRQISVKSSMLYRGKVQSCGCLKTMIAYVHGISGCVDITGKRYGKLTVLERDYGKMFSSKSSVSWWICLCDCGNIKSIRKTYLSSKIKNKGCGCMQWRKNADR